MAMRPESTGRKVHSASYNAILADDLLQGVAEIATFTGFKPRRVFYLAERGMLPVFKVGNRWCGRRSTLLSFIGQLEGGEAA
jgi:hypothetical protein